MVQPHQLPSSKISDVTDDKQLMDVVGECYEAAADPSRWSEALRRVGTFLRCPCVRILISRHLETSVALAQSYGCPERGLNDARDLHGWLFDSCLSNAQSEDPSAFRHVFATMLWSTEDSTAFVKLARPMADGPFTESDRERFDGLAPHLGRAMQISQRISESERGRRAALQALERSPYGLVLLNSQTQVLHMNARASKILGARDGLSIAKTTARTHLRRVLQKTNTRRQADLVRVLMTLPASLP